MSTASQQTQEHASQRKRSVRVDDDVSCPSSAIADTFIANPWGSWFLPKSDQGAGTARAPPGYQRLTDNVPERVRGMDDDDDNNNNNDIPDRGHHKQLVRVCAFRMHNNHACCATFILPYMQHCMPVACGVSFGIGTDELSNWHL